MTARRALRLVGRSVAVLLGVAAVAIWWLGSSVAVPETSTFWLAEPDALHELRRTAGDTGPREVHVGIIGRAEVPRWFNTAWGGLASERRVFITVQLVYPSGHVMIDAPFGAETQRDVVGDHATGFDAEQFARMQRALATAQTIFLSHLHRDHLGGLVDAEDPAGLLARTEVTPEQKAGFRRVGEVEAGDPSTLPFDVESFDVITRVRDFERLRQVAPGVVAVKSPGHTPGDLLFFIRTQDGRELFYVGDLVWSWRNVEEARSRPRAVSEWFLHEDTEAVADQLRALITFHDAHPEVEILVSHDADRLEAQMARGVVRAGLP